MKYCYRLNNQALKRAALGVSSALWLKATLLGGLLLLTGCGGSGPQATLDDYMGRVANVLELDAPDVQPYPQLQPLPQRRDRRAPTEDLRAGVLESIELRRCDLLPLIAERNSSLGKFMAPSKLVSYELRFFKRLSRCYQNLQKVTIDSDDEDFSSLLHDIYRNKSANLEAVLWNGVMLSEEMEMQFSLSAEPLPLPGNPGFGASLRALQAFADIQQRVQAYRETGQLQLPRKLAELETHYFALYSSHYGAQLQQSLALLSAYLNHTAALLEATIADRPLCFKQRPTPQAEILQNVFFNYYAARVQPYMAQVQRQGEAWLDALQPLMQPPGLQPPAQMQRYYQQVWSKHSEDGLWQQYRRAVTRHTESWQAVLRQCGLMPGADSN